MNQENGKTDQEDNQSVEPTSKPTENEKDEPTEIKILVNENDEIKIHYCAFCFKKQKNISRHLKKMHGKEVDVAKILIDEVPEAKKREMMMGLKQLGDHIHNQKVLKEGKGDLIVARKPTNPGAVHVKDYGPCQCLKWLMKDQLFDHQNNCLANQTSETKTRKKKSVLKKESTRMVIANQVLNESTSTKLEHHVVDMLTTFRNDEIGNFVSNFKFLENLEHLGDFCAFCIQQTNTLQVVIT